MTVSNEKSGIDREKTDHILFTDIQWSDALWLRTIMRRLFINARTTLM